ncbi:MAG: type II toxin-antitoxin system Phd/YefM family antitoxin [Flavobacteriaceae bacterium]
MHENSFLNIYKIYPLIIITTLSDFKKETKTYIEKVTEDFETILINRGKDKGVVLIAIDEYNALMTTTAELSEPLNQRRLFESKAAFDRREGFEKELIN